MKTKVIDRLYVESGAAGAEAETQTTRIVNALTAKSGAVYVLVEEVSADARIAISFQHGQDGENWILGNSDLFDSGGATAIKIGLSASGTPPSTSPASTR